MPVRYLQGNDHGVVRLFLIWSHLGKLHSLLTTGDVFRPSSRTIGLVRTGTVVYPVQSSRASNCLHSQGQKYVLVSVTSCVVSPLHLAASLGDRFLSLWHGMKSQLKTNKRAVRLPP